nr:hypothetical protein [Streptomyces finlayi]
MTWRPSTGTTWRLSIDTGPPSPTNPSHTQAVTRGASTPSSWKAGSSRSGLREAGTSSMTLGQTCSSSVAYGLISDSWAKPRMSTPAGVKRTEKSSPEPFSIRAASSLGPQVSS